MYVEGLSGIVNAPTGFGKTYSVFLAAVIDYINHNPDYTTKQNSGLQLLWISPLRALAKDIARAMQEALAELNIPWQVAIRNGDTASKERERQKRQMPEVLITTPESLHLLFASKNHYRFFETLKCVAVDEWHELLGSKRGVQVELSLAHLKTLKAKTDDKLLRVWGISATIGNLDEALQVLLGSDENGVIVRAQLKKEIAIHTILPETVERFPWAGHLGLNMVQSVLPVILENNSTLLFTNVRSQAELWYQQLLEAAPEELAGTIALHHSSIDMETRLWVEDALHRGVLKVVVCTASLDLGVDFRPVDTVIQVGSPKGVARFLQRAGRSGHQPGEVSNIYFVPTHSLEILEAVALEKAYKSGEVESRHPVVLAFDVLVQYMVTMATGDGFKEEELLAEVRNTNCFADITNDEWAWALAFITHGGTTLTNYDEYHKVVKIDDLYKVTSRRVAMRHRMHIGTIVGDAILQVRFLSGGFVGTIEEYFIASLSPGDAFILAGRKLEFVRIKDMVAYVKRSKAKEARVPVWGGGRMPLSSNLGSVLRNTLQQAATNADSHSWLSFLQPLFDTQKEMSRIPDEDELLIEFVAAKDGYHMFLFPFEGLYVHQALASMLAYRISQQQPITFSMAVNDYGVELRSDKPIPVDEDNIRSLLSVDNWYSDLQRSLNAAEMGKRKFRDIAVIAGLIFQGFPGEHKKQKHLQNSSGLLFDVLTEHEPAHMLLQQAYREVLTYEIQADRLHTLLKRIEVGKITITYPEKYTPFSFPIKAESLRTEELSSESLKDRILNIQKSLQ